MKPKSKKRAIVEIARNLNIKPKHARHILRFMKATKSIPNYDHKKGERHFLSPDQEKAFTTRAKRPKLVGYRVVWQHLNRPASRRTEQIKACSVHDACERVQLQRRKIGITDPVEFLSACRCPAVECLWDRKIFTREA